MPATTDKSQVAGKRALRSALPRQLIWFFALWLMGVGCVSGLAALLRAVLG